MSQSFSRFRPSLSFVLLSALLLTLSIAGGASRADVAGQPVVRTVTVLLLVIAILFGDWPDFARARVVWWLLIAAIALPLIQLAPLPPGLWASLPGRDAIGEAAAISGQPQPWRPLSLSPGATANAAMALIVPLAVLTFVTGLEAAERARVVVLMLIAILLATMIGLLQFSSGGVDNPLINESVGMVSGTFANRNHFALFLAMGCLLTPAWAVGGGGRPGWRGPVALGQVLLFMLAILATGSRAGLVLGPMGLAIGLVLAWRGIRREFGRFPRWALPVLIAALVGSIALLVLVSVVAGRAESIDRVIAVDPGQDMRSRGLPTVLDMVGTYFPFGTGLGSFDPVFRMHEPFELLKLTYFNHAHNDLLEIVLDAGLPGLLLLLTALMWWGWVSVRVWRTGRSADQMLPRLGSAMLLLVIVASIFDYPARTPMIMAVIVVAAEWLAGGTWARRGSALP